MQQESIIKYYEISILNSPLNPLIYASDKLIASGRFVRVALRGKECMAIVKKPIEKPDFKCENIKELTDYCLNSNYMKIARFISEYYFCSFGEACSLFMLLSKLKDEKKENMVAFKKYLPTLSTYQKKAFDFLNREKISLLFGDTGSGKTEVYITMIAKVLQEGKTAIFLMPEISLTPQIEKRLKVVFGEHIALWHSKVTKKRKRMILEGIENKRIKLIAGARSALFLPLPKLGLIIVDEEHDHSYKSNSRPRYNAKDLSIYFGKVLGAKVVLGSATPSLNSYYKFPNYRLIGGYIKSNKSFIYERNSKEISQNVIYEIQIILSNKKQAIIFLPTRANFKYISCFDCGGIIKCPFCSVGMSLHKKNNALKCHYCGYMQRIPKACPNCQSKNLNSFRMGTQEVKEKLCAIFPEANIEKFDRDAIKSEKKLKEILKNFNDKKIDILIGTQMLSKGHDYSNIELAVILGIDTILSQNDFKARENALSLSVQIAGRSGRGGEGKVIFQTSNREFFKKYMNDYELFLKNELKYRKNLYPPYKKLLRMLISHKDKQKANILMQKVLSCLSQNKNKEVEIVGSGEAFIEKIGGKYRYNILLRSTSAKALINTTVKCKERFCEIDMDPLSFS